MANPTLIANIVDMVRMAESGGYFSTTYTFPNGTAMVVSRNPMTKGYKSGCMAVLPIDKDGRQIDERAEEWLIALDVAVKMDILASE
jgi:hypothetical protein